MYRVLYIICQRWSIDAIYDLQRTSMFRYADLVTSLRLKLPRQAEDQAVYASFHFYPFLAVVRQMLQYRQRFQRIWTVPELALFTLPSETTNPHVTGSESDYVRSYNRVRVRVDGLLRVPAPGTHSQR